MNRFYSTFFAIMALALCDSRAQVWISEVVPNTPGADTGNEYFELRGTPNLSLSNYYLISLEGQGTTGRGDINQFFDLGAFSLGANGYLFARQAGSKYSNVHPDATVMENTVGTGWGQVNGAGSTVGHTADGTQVDLENAATTILLVNIGAGIVPTNTIDLDTNNDGVLDLPTGWTVVDSVGIMDGSAGASATDFSYGAITFRAPDTNGAYVGSCAYGNIINIPGPLTTSAGTFYVGRKGESTGSTANDWIGAIVNGAAASPLAFYFYSASDPAYTGMLLADMIYGGPNASSAPLGSLSYTPTINGGRFTNFTQLAVGGPIGDIAIDPRDNTTILFTVDNDVGGGIYRATKVAAGNWAVDSTPVVTGLDRPSGLVVQGDGTLWWVHDVTKALVRLKAPWAANVPELVITNFGLSLTDDDPIDLTFAPSNFTGTLGRPNCLVIADRGSDSDTYNALYVVDPTLAIDSQTNNVFLADPTASGLGWSDLTAITSLPQSGEVVALSSDGAITAVDGNGVTRSISLGSIIPTAGTGLALDPTTGKLWVADDVLDEVWSVDPTPGNTSPAVKELSFPLVDPTKTYRQIKFHDPGMAFSTNGAFLVVSDFNTAGGGGRLLVFHNEGFAVPTFAITNVTQTAQGVQLRWTPAGNVKYAVKRGTDVSSLTGFDDIATNLTTTTFTDTKPPPSGSYYRIVAKP